MRATRAYIAGFGTAGSLLAGAAVAFVLLSAVVAFRGWPQVGDQASPATVVLAPQHVESSAHNVRLPGTPVGVGHVAAAPIVARGGHASLAARQPSIGKVGVGDHRLAARPTKAATIVAVAAPTPKPTSACGASCGVASVANQLAGTALHASGNLGGTVAAAGQTLGSTVSGVAGALASKLGTTSPPVAKTVASTGAAVGNTVNQTAGAAGGVVSGAGQALGGVLHGLGQHQ
jgi:hypothetical protein